MNIWENKSLRSLSKERWLPINEYENLYIVSSMGRVMSLGNGLRSKRKMILSQFFDKDGYLVLALSQKNIIKQFKVHRLVALHFIPNPENKPQVNHKKGIKTDNRASQLEWSTESENKLHAYKNGLKKPSWLGVKGAANPNSIPINQLDMNGSFVRAFASAAEAERETGIFHSEITSVCKNKRNYAHGFKWEYAK